MSSSGMKYEEFDLDSTPRHQHERSDDEFLHRSQRDRQQQRDEFAKHDASTGERSCCSSCRNSVFTEYTSVLTYIQLLLSLMALCCLSGSGVRDCLGLFVNALFVTFFSLAFVIRLLRQHQPNAIEHLLRAVVYVICFLSTAAVSILYTARYAGSYYYRYSDAELVSIIASWFLLPECGIAALISFRNFSRFRLQFLPTAAGLIQNQMP